MNVNKSAKTKRRAHNYSHEKCAYTQKDFESNNGMLTTVWGPSTWHLLHTMSFNYPVSPTCDDKRNYRNFIISLQCVLPCGKCRKNLQKNFEKLPLKMKDMQNRETFSKYVYDLHEVVNTMLHKKSGLSYNDVRERYEHFRARCAIPLAKNKTVKNINFKNKKEKGCTEPIYGEKSKCVLQIIPQTTKCDTFQIDKKCVTPIVKQALVKDDRDN